MKKKISLCVAAALCAFVASAAHYYVVPGGTGDYTEANPGGNPADAATKATASGDVIHLATGTYNSSTTVIVLNGVTLIGGSDNPEETVIARSGTGDFDRVIILRQNAVVRNLTARGGYTAYQGAGILCYDGSVHGNGVISNCVVENASSKYMGGGGCGGVWYDCVIRNSVVRNTTYGVNEGSGGGVFYATLHNCVITNNTAGYCGGGIAGGTKSGSAGDNTHHVTKAYNCLIGWNRAPFGGGAGASQVMTSRDLCQLYGCTVISNTASTMGGGAFLCTISNSVVCTNYVPRTSDDGVTVAAGGGVIYCNVFDSTIEGNRCVRSGAGAANSNLTGCQIVNNFASHWGGGTYDCPLVKNCLLAGNTGHHGGAGFMGYFENCVMTNNTSNPFHGSATYNATSRNCIVVGNYATTYLAHCRGWHYGDIVYGNRNGYTTYPSGIGADTDREGETVPVVNCTVWGNLNGSKNVGRATLTNSIVWSVENIYSAVNSFWRNGTVANQTDCISGEDKDPKFVGIDGTVMLTEAEAKSAPPSAWEIRAYSPCRDTGLLLPGQASETDCLGHERVKYAGVDMGALECIQSLGTYFLFR